MYSRGVRFPVHREHERIGRAVPAVAWQNAPCDRCSLHARKVSVMVGSPMCSPGQKTLRG